MIPKATKYKKYQKGSLPNKQKHRKQNIIDGSFAICAKNFGIICEKQIETGQRVLKKKLKNKGSVWVKVYAHLPKTAKPVEVRMGKGKGSVQSWITKIKAGTTLYEMEGVSVSTAKELLKLCNEKMPVVCYLKCHF